MSYRYAYPHPAVATDIAIFTIRDASIHLLLIERGLEPFRGRMALPGGFVGSDETVEAAARRELNEETGIDLDQIDYHLEQVGVFSNPERDIRQQDGHDAYRVISVAFMALIPSQELRVEADTDAERAEWIPLHKVRSLAFDHNEIVSKAHRQLARHLSDRSADMSREEELPVALSFLRDPFTMSDLKTVYDLFSEGKKPMDMSNFRKMVKAHLDLAEVGTAPATGRHRPEKLYSIKTALS